MPRLAISECANGFIEDYERLIHAFCEKKSTQWAVFEATLLEQKFDCLFDFRLNDRECREFTEECMRIVTIYLLPPCLPEVRICSLFTLYTLFSTHPYPTPVLIRLMLSQWRQLNSFMRELESLNQLIHITTMLQGGGDDVVDGVLNMSSMGEIYGGGEISGLDVVEGGDGVDGVLNMSSIGEMGGGQQLRGLDVGEGGDDSDAEGVLNIAEFINDSSEYVELQQQQQLEQQEQQQQLEQQQLQQQNQQQQQQHLEHQQQQLTDVSTDTQFHQPQLPPQQSPTTANNTAQLHQQQQPPTKQLPSSLKQQQQQPILILQPSPPPQQQQIIDLHSVLPLPQQQPLQPLLLPQQQQQLLLLPQQQQQQKCIQTYQDVLDVFNLLKQQNAFTLAPNDWLNSRVVESRRGRGDEGDRMELLMKRGCVLEKIVSHDVIQELTSLRHKRKLLKDNLTLKPGSLCISDGMDLFADQVQSLISSHEARKRSFLNRMPHRKSADDGDLEENQAERSRDDDDDDDRAMDRKREVLKRAYAAPAPTERFFEKKLRSISKKENKKEKGEKYIDMSGEKKHKKNDKKLKNNKKLTTNQNDLNPDKILHDNDDKCDKKSNEESRKKKRKISLSVGDDNDDHGDDNDGHGDDNDGHGDDNDGSGDDNDGDKDVHGDDNDYLGDDNDDNSDDSDDNDDEKDDRSDDNDDRGGDNDAYCDDNDGHGNDNDDHSDGNDDNGGESLQGNDESSVEKGMKENCKNSKQRKKK